MVHATEIFPDAQVLKNYRSHQYLSVYTLILSTTIVYPQDGIKVPNNCFNVFNFLGKVVVKF